MIAGTMNYIRIASLFAVLAAGSCAAPMNDAGGLVDDPMANHPIAVEPTFHTLKVSFSAPDAGLMPEDSQKFEAFVADFVQHGNGAISISVPSGPGANVAITYFGERLASAGVPRDRILVGSRDDTGGKVELGYIGYGASVAPCGDWSTSVAYTATNRVSANFGCAVQHNIAAQVADPRDLIQPQPLAGGDASRRATVYDNYKAGKPTGAEHTTEQSGAVSDVNKN